MNASWTDTLNGTVGQVTVATSSFGGHPPEFFADLICTRLMLVASTAPEPIRLQAEAFRDQIKIVVLDGIKQAILSDRTYRKG